MPENEVEEDMAKRKVTEVAKEFLEEFLSQHGYQLYNIKYVKEAGDWFLNVYIDLEGIPDGKYVSTEDCEMVSRYLSDKMDEADVIEQNYYLVVSSPGMDRELFLPEHYEIFVGKLVDVKLYKAINKTKTFQGVLKGIENDQVVIDLDQETLQVPLNEIAQCRLAVVF